MRLRLHLGASIALSLFAVSANASNDTLAFQKAWTFKHTFPGQISEIPAYDPISKTLWVAGVVGVDILSARSGALLDHIDVTGDGSINSISIHNGIAALAVEAKGDRRKPGNVLLYSTKTRAPLSGVHRIEVGSLPDMLTFTPDGKTILVANEATPNAVADTPYVSPDPLGTVSVINVAKRSVVATPNPNVAPFTGSNLRTNTGMDFEPEYIAVAKNNKTAFVTLQEANGLGILNLKTNQFEKVVGLGVKDFSLNDNGFGGSNYIDPNDKDSKIELRSASVKGLYQPDSVASYEFAGKTYLVMANEGDTREDDGDKVRASTIPGSPKDLERLNVSKTDSAPGSLVTFGGRSFTIRDNQGNVIFDSGNKLEQEAIKLNIYDDTRSDDKGVEPEGVTLLKYLGKTFAFIGLERTTKAAVAIYDVTNPMAPKYLDMIVTSEDVSPEGLTTFVLGARPYLAISNEISNTTTAYRLGKVGN
jgi:hypothetical protein